MADSRRQAPGLPGRRSECETLDRLVASVRTGESRVLVLHGEAGIGKTALLDYLRERASGCRIARASGVESEMELAFTGLHQLCAPMLGDLERLPGPQRDALRVAFGLQEGGAPDRFLVALAALSLLAEVAEASPLVCLIDDAQWLDQASSRTLTFVARRLLAERIAMVFAVRESSERGALDGLPELVVEALGDADAERLLTSGIPGPLDERVRDRVIAEAHGNPLALLELPRGLTPEQVAGGFGLLDGRPLTSRIEQSFVRRIQSLPPDSQRLLLTAAAEPVGDAALVWRASERLGIGADAAAAAEAAGLIELGARVQFRHPLVRSAVYRAAAAPDRQETHRALAEETDTDADPDRRAWHRAQAATGLDETVADELERSADRAQSRGGVAAAAAFLERATALTPDPVRRAGRALTAAQAKFDAAAPEAALELLAAADPAQLDELQRARRSPSSARPARTPPGCCSRQPGGSIRSILRWPARRTSRRSGRPSSPAGSSRGAACRPSPTPPAPRPRRDGRPARSTCCSTVWQPGSRRATPPPRRRCGGRSTRSGRRASPPRTTCGGSGWRAPSRRNRSPPTCGTTRRGTGSPAGR
jgi:hypothetical protein